MAGLASGRVDIAMDDSINYNHTGVNSYERTCDSNVGQTDQKKSSPNYTIQGVLHFIQSEWTRLEMQRSQWEVERAELQARIAFLQGERRGQENLKQDLIRRIKMLEYGLKQERVKFHQYKASVSGIQDEAANCSRSTRNESERTKSYILEPAEKLAQYTEQTLESNVKWRESRLRLKQLLQEIGYTDAVLNVREARVRQLLLSTASWSKHSDVDSKSKNFESGNLWTAEKLNTHGGDKASMHDEQTRCALAEMDDVVRLAQDYLEPSSSDSVPNNELGDESIEPDTTGQSLGSPDGQDLNDTAWVNRFRRTGSASGEAGKRRSQVHSPKFSTENEQMSKGVESTSAISFLNSLTEGGSPGQMKRFGRKHAADTNILDLINTLSEKVDHDSNDGFLANQVLESSGALPYPSPGEAITTVSSQHISFPHVVPANTRWQPDISAHDSSGTQLGTGKDLSTLNTAISGGGHLSEMNHDTNEALVLGDLASLTVANEAENALNGEICDSNMPHRTTFDSGLLPSSGFGSSELTSSTAASSAFGSSALISGRKLWSTRNTLRGHFDGIRSVVFHPTECALYTAGEDGCVMLWNLSKCGSSLNVPGKANLSSPYSGPVDELSPVHIYCGHNGPVLCATTPTPTLAPTLNSALFTGGLDGTVRSWRLPSASSDSGIIDLYAAHELESLTGPVLKTSDSPVWALALHPSNPVLLSASANGTIDFWSIVDSSDSNNLLTPVLSVNLDRIPITSSTSVRSSFGRPTCIHFLVNRPDALTASQCVIGTTMGWLILMDMQTGQIINYVQPPLTLQSHSDENNPTVNLGNAIDAVHCQNLPADWDPRALNDLGSHQTLSLVIGAHEDRCIRFYDISRLSDRSSGVNTACVDTMVTHLDSVTSLAVDPHGLYLLTGSHDASIRVWDMESRACIQEMTNHGFKYNESVHTVALHPQLPLAASGGADAVCKVYVTSD